jgi:hypothetical protein
MRHGRNFESGTGRFDEKYIALPSGDRRGVASRYCPENGTTSGLDHFPSRKTRDGDQSQMGEIRVLILLREIEFRAIGAERGPDLVIFRRDDVLGE